MLGLRWLKYQVASHKVRHEEIEQAILIAKDKQLDIMAAASARHTELFDLLREHRG